ncbi:hypothetical protein FIBSPDRAFT_877033 [Athelia psychrophila]|uniref:Uncharacterized protein n=1 Tax=Athelia psychrophila TaxID=1759441 RepID=A0A167WBG8_9AGAM|nr:hypothetical protein FIBSPDRAFT_877033 [Fibularhizoctonia sp. CBS 109695]
MSPTTICLVSAMGKARGHCRSLLRGSPLADDGYPGRGTRHTDPSMLLNHFPPGSPPGL